jgi:molybdopterin-guanine dinucleotide biosynthesis protein B
MRINHPHTLHIVGEKNSGKSGLIEFLIHTLKNKGIRVGAIKHSSHLHNLDKAGSDSHRFSTAGAVPTIFSTPAGFAIFYNAVSTEEQIVLWNAHLADCDIVLVESFREIEGPKIWICADQSWRKTPAESIAVVDEQRVHPEIPTFKFGDDSLCSFIISKMQIKPVMEI